MLQEIQQKIEQALPGAQVEVEDQSAGHAEHNASGAHIGLKVVYSGFKDKTLVEQHQIIYKILEEEMKQKIHALALKTEVP